MRLRILKGPLRGYKWIVGAAAGEAKGLSIILNLSEQEQIKIAKEIISKNNVCFDVGANVGLYSLLFSRYSKLVYAFEPLPRNLSFLYKTIEINQIRNVIIVPCAVADKNKLSWFQVGKNYSLGRLTTKGNQPVMVLSLDNFIKESLVVPDIIKIDVEGSELSVLRGSKNLLSESKPIILLSTHGDKVKKECLDFLKQLNYKILKPLDTDSIEKATEFLIKP
ncbi:MAG: FkbM family methyltransferase [Candidatus Hodarchaeota archaeon]